MSRTLRTLVTVLALLLVSTAALAQNMNSGNKNAKPKKPKPAVDCTKVDDAGITADVKARLAKAASLKDLTINVATSAGTVTLTGSAKKSTQKGTATRVAKAAACVKKVDNQMTVEKSMTAAPMNSNSKKKKTSNKNM